MMRSSNRWCRWRRTRWIIALVLAVGLGGVVGCGDGGYSSGDRVLVAKVPYDLKIKPPERYDVVVFKYPQEPVKKGVPTNYIKRLLGMPGEVIAIFFGQLFRLTPEPGVPVPGTPNDMKPFDEWAASNQPHDREFKDFVRSNFETGKFEILRNPPVVMLAERRIVFDNNHQPSDLKMLKARWTPRDGSGWKSSADRKSFTFPADKKIDAVDWLTYQHLPRPEGPIVGGTTESPHLITDTMGYNSYNLDPSLEGFPRLAPQIYTNWAGNLMLEANVHLDGSAGEFWMEVNKGVDHFQAKFDLGTGLCTLFRIDDKDGKERVRQLDAKPTGLTGAGEHLVRFANFDSRLTVWVDNTLPFGDGAAYDPIELGTKESPIPLNDILARCGPRVNDLARPASLGAKNTGATVTDLRLWRDTFYTMHIRNDIDLNAQMLVDPNAWEPFHHVQPQGYCVYPGHYFCLGDNSTSSADSRQWGLVPERLMLGRALAVYFPVDRAGLIR